MRVPVVGISAALFVKTVMMGSDFGIAPELEKSMRMRLRRASLELQRHHQDADQRKEPQPSPGVY